MRFMIIVKATKDSEAGLMPSAELLRDMGKFNQDLIDAGIFVAADGLQASSKGARVSPDTIAPSPWGHSRIRRTWLPVIGSGT